MGPEKLFVLFFLLLESFLEGTPTEKQALHHPGKKIIRIGDQLFLANENEGDGKKDNREIYKRSADRITQPFLSVLEPQPNNDYHQDRHHKTTNQDHSGFYKRSADENNKSLLSPKSQTLDTITKNNNQQHQDHVIHKRAAIKNRAFRWRHKTVPYSFDRSFGKKDRKMVKSAMDEWAEHTCLKFRPARRWDRNKVKFINGKGCFSFVGMVDEGTQEISLDKQGCRSLSTTLHEIGHALGMFHTHVRPDRDQYVNIDLSDVDKDERENFLKQTWKYAHHYGVNYDFKSIMHYDGTAFTTWGETAIETLDPKWQQVIGSAEHLSFGDIEMMNKMYKCAPARCKLRDSDCPGISFVGTTCECMCPGPSNTKPVVPCSERNIISGSGDGEGNESESGSRDSSDEYYYDFYNGGGDNGWEGQEEGDSDGWYEYNGGDGGQWKYI